MKINENHHVIKLIEDDQVPVVAVVVVVVVVVTQLVEESIVHMYARWTDAALDMSFVSKLLSQRPFASSCEWRNQTPIHKMYKKRLVPIHTSGHD